MVHRLALSDIPLIFSSVNIALPNEAVVRETLGREGGVLSLAGVYLKQWLPVRRQQRTWVCTEGRRLKGILSARGCYGSSVWEVVHLALPEERDASLALLDSLKSLGRKDGVTRVFLRLSQDIPYAQGLQSSGFSPYLKECLYLLQGAVTPKREAFSTPYLHRRRKSDDLPLFQLYSSCVPTPVRQVEGATFKDWQQCQENGSIAGREWVVRLEGDGNLLGWLRVNTRRGIPLLELMVSPASENFLENMLDFVLARIGSPLFCLTAAHQEKLQIFLSRRGFQPVAEYSIMVRQLTQRVTQTVLAPLGA